MDKRFKVIAGSVTAPAGFLASGVFCDIKRLGTGKGSNKGKKRDLGLIAGELTSSLPPGTRFPLDGGLVCVTDPGPQVSHLLTHMFLHGSWMHLLGNMWFLWLFGNNIEDSMGRMRFLVFYLLCGLAAAAERLDQVKDIRVRDRSR